MNLKLKISKSEVRNLLLLLVWLAIATGLRFTNLAGKPPWTDEFSTLVFSLGNSFQPIPLDQAITSDVLLQPLQPNPEAGVTQVVQHLLSESTHPPVYFVLTHWWLQLWSTDSGGLVSVWGARSLSALFGAASIPAIYHLSWLAWRSRIVSHLAAAVMAVSPYGIFLAQEARHYTLATLWVIASLCCLVVAIRQLQNHTLLPGWLVICWSGINFLGISTHYFFSLTLVAEAIALIFLWWRQSRIEKFLPPYTFFHSPPLLTQQIGFVAVVSAIGGLIWLPNFWQQSIKLTEWIQAGDRSGLAWVNPIFQALAAWFTMLALLPVEAPALPVVIVSAVAMTLFFLWALPILYRGLRVQWQQPETQSMTQLFAVFIVGAIALFFLLTYGFGIDVTRGARYNFVYFPAVIALIGASLAVCWYTPRSRRNSSSRQKLTLPAGKTAVIIIWLVGLLSSITVVCNLGYQKYYRPDLLVQLIQQVSQSPVLIATTHQNHAQIGEMMGIAREFKLANSPTSPQFLLAQQHQDPKISTAVLQKTLAQLPRPFDLWLVNFSAPAEVKDCISDPQALPAVNGYNYQIYHCIDYK